MPPFTRPVSQADRLAYRMALAQMQTLDPRRSHRRVSVFSLIEELNRGARMPWFMDIRDGLPTRRIGNLEGADERSS